MKDVQQERAAARRGARFCLRLFALLWVLSLGACDREESALIRITHLERADEDELLLVHGEGFPSGRRGRATFRGVLHRPAAESREVELHFPCRAETGRQLVIALHQPDHEAGLFEGALEIGFAGMDSNAIAVLAKRQHAVVRLSEHNLKTRLLADRAARGFMHDLGITHVEPQRRGLLIGDLAKEGLAAHAGLLPLDVVLRLDGAPVEQASDLTVLPHTRAVLMDLERAGKPISLVVPLEKKARASAAPLMTLLAFAISFLGVLVIPLKQSKPSQRTFATRPLAIGAALTFLAGLLPKFTGFDLRWALPPALLSFKIALGLDLLRRGKRSHEIVRALLPVAALTLALTSFNVLANTATLRVSDPQPWPAFEWPLLCAPPAWLALAIIARTWPLAVHQGSFWSQVSAAWLACTSAAAVAAFGLGGGSLSPLVSEPFGRWFIWILKSAFAFWLLHEVLRSVLGRYENALALLCPALAAAFVALDPSPTITWVFSGVAAGALCSVIMKHLLRTTVHKQTLEGRDPLLEPFR